jgi:hypothetical protein
VHFPPIGLFQFQLCGYQVAVKGNAMSHLLNTDADFEQNKRIAAQSGLSKSDLQAINESI